jgi:hypothetical protein
MLLHLEEQSVRETMYASPAAAAMNNRKLSWVFCNDFKRSLNSPSEAFTQFGPNSFIPVAGSLQVGVRLG